MKALKILQYLSYLTLIEDIAKAIKAAKRGDSFSINGTYKVEGKTVDVAVTGTPRA